MRRRALAAAAARLPLVRDFLHDSLYHPTTGYFSRSASPVGRVDPPIHFANLPGRQGYQQALAALYQEQQVAWITPSELFTPVYGSAIASFILQHHAAHASGEPLSIVEVGGGNGTLAKDIMVLDNLPHDRVVFCGGAWHQTHVHTASSGATPTEVLAPLSDAAIAEVVTVIEPLLLEPRTAALLLQRLVGLKLCSGHDHVAFVPTGAWALLKTLHVARPQHCLLAADFDFLPEVAVRGHNAPLVSAMQDGTSHDFGTYLVSPGTADIFFPTDFEMLRRLHAAAAPPGTTVSADVAKSAKFFSRYADLARTALCGTAWNPLRDDFSNTSMFIGSTLEH